MCIKINKKKPMIEKFLFSRYNLTLNCTRVQFNFKLYCTKTIGGKNRVKLYYSVLYNKLLLLKPPSLDFFFSKTSTIYTWIVLRVLVGKSSTLKSKKKRSIWRFYLGSNMFAPCSLTHESCIHIFRWVVRLIYKIK